MDRTIPKILAFDRFALDLRRGLLRAGDQDIELRPKAFEVLCYLVENAGRLVALDELHKAVWGEVAVTNDSIVQCIRELRSKLGDNEHSLIKTVARRGYVLEAAVSELEAQPPSGSSARSSSPPSGSSPSDSSLSISSASRSPPPPPEGPQVEFGPQPPRMITQLRVALAVVMVLLVGGALWAMQHLAGPPSAATPSHVQVASNVAGNTVGDPQPRAVFKDCAECPEMVVLPAGDFMMGSPAGEVGRQKIEGLPRRVAIPGRFAIGKFKVTVDQFSRFVAESGMTVSNDCRVIVGIDRDSPVWGEAEASFRRPGFDTAGSHPVVCVSWYEAQAYAAWLQRRTGRPYRLPTEAEWEYAARAGTSTTYSFGDDETELCAYARFADLSSQFGWHDACRSEIAASGTIPVGSLRPNPWGIFDVHGNAWEWVADCWTPIPSDIPTNGSAFVRPKGCEEAVIRGGSFASGSRRVRSATRGPAPIAVRNYNDGIRVALSLGD
jgi:formylglycine-generating enzyme required for sulfatase activity/DNA-binding winged helix-turn-helix (wHTH) protein